VSDSRRGAWPFLGALLLLAVVIGAVTSRGSDHGRHPRAATEGQATPSPSPSASASGKPPAAPITGPRYCGASQDVEEITVEQWAGGLFRVSVRPTPAARHADDLDGATDTMWTALRRCVRGFDTQVGDSLYDQLRCHEHLALIPASGGKGYATGPTFDLESWRPSMSRGQWITTRCGNTLGTNPTAASIRTYRPDGVPRQYTDSGERA
jgi:hypothetical protein